MTEGRRIESNYLKAHQELQEIKEHTTTLTTEHDKLRQDLTKLKDDDESTASHNITELRGKLTNAQARCLQMDEDRTTLLDQLNQSRQRIQHYTAKIDRVP